MPLPFVKPSVAEKEIISLRTHTESAGAISDVDYMVDAPAVASFGSEA